MKVNVSESQTVRFFPLKASGKMFFIQIASVCVRRPRGSKNKMNEQTSSNNQVSKTLVNVVFIFLGEQSFLFRVIIVRIVLIFRHPLSHRCFVSHQILGCFFLLSLPLQVSEPIQITAGPVFGNTAASTNGFQDHIGRLPTNDSSNVAPDVSIADRFLFNFLSKHLCGV